MDFKTRPTAGWLWACAWLVWENYVYACMSTQPYEQSNLQGAENVQMKAVCKLDFRVVYSKGVWPMTVTIK